MPCLSTKRYFPGKVGKWIFRYEKNSQKIVNVRMDICRRVWVQISKGRSERNNEMKLWE